MTSTVQKGLEAALKAAPVVPVMVIETVADAVPLKAISAETSYRSVSAAAV